MDDWERFNDQFRETVDERNDRLRAKREIRNREILLGLICDLSDGLCDEGPDWSEEGLANLRHRVANALPSPLCPEWLLKYRGAQMVQS